MQTFKLTRFARNFHRGFALTLFHKNFASLLLLSVVDIPADVS